MRQHDRWTWILAVFALVGLVIALSSRDAQAQEQLPAPVQTRAAQIVEKAKEFGKGEQAQEAIDDMQEFRGRMQSQLDGLLDPVLHPAPTRTTVPQGYGRRVYNCPQEYDRALRVWRCVRTGR